MEKKSNDTLCLAPWLSLHTWPDGSTYPCCVWNADDPIGNINDTDLKFIWNNDRLKDIRLKMLNGEKLKSCDRCYKLEQTEPHSYRLKINKDFKDSFNVIEKTKLDGSLEEMEIKLWDFRLSNFCNLKCRSCGLDLSSSWYADTVELKPNLKGKVKALITVNDKVSFMDMIEDQYEHVEEVYFAGGEPLITPEHYTILNKLIEKGNTNIRLRYSTNLQNIVHKGRSIIDYWKHFSNVEVLVSLDGVKEKGEYIRKGLNYTELKQNVLTLKDSGVSFTQLGFMVTFGVLNYEHLFDMVLDFLKNDLIDKVVPIEPIYGTRIGINGPVPRPREVLFSPIFRPQHLDCSYLPSVFKKRFARRLANFDKELYLLGADKTTVSDIIIKLTAVHKHSVSNNFNEGYMNMFIDKTKQLDTIRKENFSDVFPEYNFEVDFLKENNSI